MARTYEFRRGILGQPPRMRLSSSGCFQGENAHGQGEYLGSTAQVHVLALPAGPQQPDGRATPQHQPPGRLAAERARRLLVGFLAQQHGHGGIALLARITGLDRNTIARGRASWTEGDTFPTAGVRRREPDASGWRSPSRDPEGPGGVCWRTPPPGIPVSGMKWTHRSLRQAPQGPLRRRGIAVGPSDHRPAVGAGRLLAADQPQAAGGGPTTRTGTGSSAT